VIKLAFSGNAKLINIINMFRLITHVSSATTTVNCVSIISGGRLQQMPPHQPQQPLNNNILEVIVSTLCMPSTNCKGR
jgi:hypothetical protein